MRQRVVLEVSESVKLPMKKGFGRTDRTDDWWKGPTAMAAYLGLMIVYATWRGFMESDILFFSELGASSCENWDSAKSFKDVSRCQTMSIEQESEWGTSHVLSPLYSPLIFPTIIMDSQRFVVAQPGDVYTRIPSRI